MLDALVARGGDVNAGCEDGWSPLVALVRYGHGDARERLGRLLACPSLDLGPGALAPALALASGVLGAVLEEEVRVGGGGGGCIR